VKWDGINNYWFALLKLLSTSLARYLLNYFCATPTIQKLLNINI